jgi:hypothetical protein
MSTMDYINLIIGSLGLIVAVMSIGWQIQTHRHSKAERADARLSWDISQRGQFLSVTVVNTGDPQLYVKQVELVVKHVECEQIAANGKKAIAVATSLQFQSRNEETGPLQPGEERVYVYPEHLARTLYSAQEPSRVESVWISVKSSKGEVARIDGTKVLSFLEKREGKGKLEAKGVGNAQCGQSA